MKKALRVIDNVLNNLDNKLLKLHMTKVENFLDSISLVMFNMKRSTAIKEGVCVLCGRPITHKFMEITNDEIKEFNISAVCPICQDALFNSEKFGVS